MWKNLFKNVAARILMLLAKVFGDTYKIGWISFVDLEGHSTSVPSEDIRKLIDVALGEISAAGPQFTALVNKNVKCVCRHTMEEPRTSHEIRTYESPFAVDERSNPMLLASRLVWAAKYFEVVGRGSIWTSHRRIERAEWEAYQARDWFVRQFPGWQNWLQQVRANERDRDVGPAV